MPRSGSIAHGVNLVLGDGVDGVRAERQRKPDGAHAEAEQHSTRIWWCFPSACGRKRSWRATPASRSASAAESASTTRCAPAIRTSGRLGDAVEVKNWVTGQWELVPLAGPANRQGRVAADAICGRDTKFRGVQGTAVCGFFGMTVALTGATEKSLRRAGIEGL